MADILSLSGLATLFTTRYLPQLGNHFSNSTVEITYESLMNKGTIDKVIIACHNNEGDILFFNLFHSLKPVGLTVYLKVNPDKKLSEIEAYDLLCDSVPFINVDFSEVNQIYDCLINIDKPYNMNFFDNFTTSFKFRDFVKFTDISFTYTTTHTSLFNRIFKRKGQRNISHFGFLLDSDLNIMIRHSVRVAADLKEVNSINFIQGSRQYAFSKFDRNKNYTKEELFGCLYTLRNKAIRDSIQRMLPDIQILDEEPIDTYLTLINMMTI